MVPNETSTSLPLTCPKLFKGCDSNFEVNIFQILKVATNGTSMIRLNFVRKSCLLNCWSLLLKFSSAIQVHIV